MFDHVKFGVSDYAASKAFFLKALEPLGVAVVSEGPPTYGVELSGPKGKASLCLYQTEEKPAHLHLAFTAENRQQVEAFYRAALEAGGKDNGAPGLCPEYHANYYAAFVIGPDGHNIEVVCHDTLPWLMSVSLGRQNEDCPFGHGAELPITFRPLGRSHSCFRHRWLGTADSGL